MSLAQFPTAQETAVAVKDALANNNIEAADRLITELLGGVLASAGGIPVGVIDEPGEHG